MGIFSIFSKPKPVNEYKSISSKENFDEYFNKDFFSAIVDTHKSMMLYFFQGKGWIGANKTFFETMNIHNIKEFTDQHDSVRDLFLSESEEIFTESDKSWLDYIRKYQSDGYRVSISKPNGDVVFIDAKCHVFAKNKNFYILELEDVTDLYKAKLKTKEVEQLKTKFLANIGHEFRTPMNGILGFIELIKQTDLDKRQREYLGMINHSSKNLMTNIETLLDLSQLQGGRLEVEPAAFNLLPEMEKLAYNICKQGVEKGIKVLTFIDPKLPQEILSDVKKIRQVMFSLAHNAIKFTPRGGKVIIEVKLLKRQQNGDCSIGFGVRDNGKGISNEQISYINEPFTAGNHADERLGVGLSLSNGLVNLLGSELRIQSEEGEGTYVNFVLDFKGSKGQNYKMMPKKKVKILLLDQTKVDEANFLTIYLRSFAIDVIKSNQLDENVYNGIDALYIVADQSNSSWMLELGAKHLYSMHSLDPIKDKTTKLEIKSQVNALVVEDNLINQRLIQILLQGYDILVSTASNGVEAVNMSEKNKYDIIFMDIDMPEKNGIDANKDIKAARKNASTPIVALTAMAMEGDREMLLSEGLDDYLSKPLTREKLESILSKYLKVSA